MVVELKTEEKDKKSKVNRKIHKQNPEIKEGNVNMWNWWNRLSINQTLPALAT